MGYFFAIQVFCLYLCTELSGYACYQMFYCIHSEPAVYLSAKAPDAITVKFKLECFVGFSDKCENVFGLCRRFTIKPKDTAPLPNNPVSAAQPGNLALVPCQAGYQP